MGIIQPKNSRHVFWLGVSLLVFLFWCICPVMNILEVRFVSIMYALFVLMLMFYNTTAAFANKQTVALAVAYALYMSLSLNYDLPHSLKWYAIEFLGLASCLGMASLYAKEPDVLQDNKMIRDWACGIVLLSVMLTLFACIRNPDIARMKVTEERALFSEGGKWQEDIVGSYAFIHGIVFLLPVLIYNIKRERKTVLRIFYGMFLLLTLFMLVKASFSAPLFMGVVISIISIFMTRRASTNVVVIIMFGILFVLLVQTHLLVAILEMLEPFFEGTMVIGKLKDIASSILQKGAEGTVEGRQNLYQFSWNTFLEFPLFGCLDQKMMGGHAFFIDLLAVFGIFGVLPFALALFFMYRTLYKTIAPDSKIYFLLAIFSFIVLGFLKNNSMPTNGIIQFIIAPLLLRRRSRRNIMLYAPDFKQDRRLLVQHK